MTADGPGAGGDADDSAPARNRIRGSQTRGAGQTELGGVSDAPAEDGRWKWKGLELDPDANRVAEAGLAARRQAEGRDAEGDYGAAGITPAMRRIEAEVQFHTPESWEAKQRTHDTYEQRGEATEDLLEISADQASVFIERFRSRWDGVS
jgi:hypothetical protein